jgi:hypothetical protein
VIPNCTENHRPPVDHRDGDAVSLLVASSDSVRVDFLVPALKRVCSEFGDGVRIVAIGPPGEALQAAGVPVARIDMLPYEDFQRFISTQHNSIGLIPLDDSHFSSCKSAIKYVDYALSGIPVRSNVPPYADASSTDQRSASTGRRHGQHWELIGSGVMPGAGSAGWVWSDSRWTAAQAWQKVLDAAALQQSMAIQHRGSAPAQSGRRAGDHASCAPAAILLVRILRSRPGRAATPVARAALNSPC